jgi:hypothetical protein
MFQNWSINESTMLRRNEKSITVLGGFKEVVQ